MADAAAALVARFRALPKVVQDTARRVMEQNAKELVRDMARRAPKDHGDLADSIRWTWGPPPPGTMHLGSLSAPELGDVTISVYAGNEATMVSNSRGIKYQNAILQEYGTKPRAAGGRNPQRANPYFRPAIKALGKRFNTRMKRAITKAVKEAWNG